MEEMGKLQMTHESHPPSLCKPQLNLLLRPFFSTPLDGDPSLGPDFMNMICDDPNRLAIADSASPAVIQQDREG